MKGIKFLKAIVSEAFSQGGKLFSLYPSWSMPIQLSVSMYIFLMTPSQFHKDPATIISSYA
jgi:hypothetical protein